MSRQSFSETPLYNQLAFMRRFQIYMDAIETFNEVF